MQDNQRNPKKWIRTIPPVFFVLVLIFFFENCVTGQEDNLVYNGDFEVSSYRLPPPGWSMWGNIRYKNPLNFRRDTSNPHSGVACLRIYHPMNSSGYVVSTPERAIQPRAGMMYEISFWARSDQSGKSLFGLTSYESIRPFVDAPSPVWQSIDVTTEWKKFKFIVREGWDMFAERSRYLLPTFKAAMPDTEERILWIDDVVVIERPSDRTGRLVDLDQVESPPLEHRLKPGEELSVILDVSKRIGQATRAATGISFHRVAGWTGQPFDRQGRYTLDPDLENAIRELMLPMTRFYGVADEFFSPENAIDRVVQLCIKLDIPLDRVVLELEPQDANSTISPEVWARMVRYVISKGYGLRYWEVSNEPSARAFNSDIQLGKAFPDSDTYVNHVKEVYSAIKRESTAAQVGIAISAGSVAWGNYVLKQAAGSYDFVVGHYYAGMNAYHAAFEPLVIGQNYRILEEIMQVNELIRRYNPGRSVYQLDTEWGMSSSGPSGENADYAVRNANSIGMLHRAVRLIYYVREGMLRGASSWQMLSNIKGPGFGVLSQQAIGKRYLNYWLYYYFNRHIGEWAIDLEGEAPFYTPAPSVHGEASGPLTPLLATISMDGQILYLVLANGSSSREIPCRISLPGFSVASVSGMLLTHPGRDGDPLVSHREEVVSNFPTWVQNEVLRCSLPPQSIVFLSVRRV